VLEHVKHFRGAVHRMRTTRKPIGLPVLHRLKHATDIVAESLRKCGGISTWKQGDEICGFRRVTPKQLNGVFALEDTRHLVTGEKHWDLA
jgi:hypothetical protein